MKLKLDENLPDDLVPILKQYGHDVETVPGEKLAGKDDASIWQAAQAEQRLLITQDLDFSDLRKFVPGTHAGLILMRLRKASRGLLIQRVTELFGDHDPSQWEKCVVVVTERKIRVRRP